jgi:hypothetical protein
MEMMIIALIISAVLVAKLHSDLEKANKQHRIDTWSKVEGVLKEPDTTESLLQRLHDKEASMKIMADKLAQRRVDEFNAKTKGMIEAIEKAKKPVKKVAKRSVGRPRKDSLAKTGVEKGIENWNNAIKKVAKKTK